jgi:hypothetical protein
MKDYEHSEAFSKLKNIREKIEKNLTSLEYLQTLDMFLWNALSPIQDECPAFFNNYVAKVVASQTLKSSTKFSSDDRQKMPIHLFNMVTSNDSAKAREHAKKMYLNRGLLFGLIGMFLKTLAGYEKLHSPFYEMDSVLRKSEMWRMERSVGLRPGGALYNCILEVKRWDERAYKWKEMITEKYYRLALNSARTTYKDYNHYVKLDDIVQIYLMVTSRAIDRCDARQGVLTTFIMNWFKSGRSEVSEMAKTQSDQSYESLVEELGDSVSDVIGFVQPDTSSELIEHIAFVSKPLDRLGIVRAPMGIPETVSAQHRAILEMFVLEETSA